MAIIEVNKFGKLLNIKRYSKSAIAQYTSILRL